MTPTTLHGLHLLSLISPSSLARENTSPGMTTTISSSITSTDPLCVAFGYPTITSSSGGVQPLMIAR
ncbi:hypothetical protein PF005_g10705 [Phytophthora fragariae]|uniref:RxLR effector protein n=1 Tax=Phytophthora fragariae TaxID=53985 RepID=A0A6A3ZDT2_9STRA|nr:hypothetical protein PF003_g36368 [Phytophthora fragariae]KAE8938132.1 hypothetical protein PF009_g11970 [Phytophthora fragariae]KAE9011114.1 hypothetical protein PF011_g9509 [Phytophthora fragariae]KAE9113756.1 hypothetical protein PF007_g10627 [Phytophthora fragariae]KAE9115057.1 hypothetical protein PF010_g9484 [Phytophthora fragariae]